MEIGDLKAASQAADDGQWVGEDVHGLPGVRLRVRSMSSPQVSRALGRLMRRAPEDMRDADGGLTDEAQDAIDDQILAEHVLCEWEGLTDNGEPIPYSLDLAREWVGYSLFWSAVRVSMQHVTREARSAVESLAKNSQAPSGKKPKAA